MATKISRAGYNWPSVRKDCNQYVKACKKCQEFGSLNHIPMQELLGIISPWPFPNLVMDILCPFPVG